MTAFVDLIFVWPQVTVGVKVVFADPVPQSGLHGLHVGPVGDDQRGETVLAEACWEALHLFCVPCARHVRVPKG